MPRPHKNRWVNQPFDVSYFKPSGIPMRLLDEVELGVDELEAIRLADAEELYQEEAAQKMGVSRATFSNIVNAAHRKIADALTNGKAIRIQGGAIDFNANKESGELPRNGAGRRRHRGGRCKG